MNTGYNLMSCSGYPSSSRNVIHRLPGWAGIDPLAGTSIPKVIELQWLVKLCGAQQGHAFLQIVALFASYPHFVALNGRLHFYFAIFDKFDDFPG